MYGQDSEYLPGVTSSGQAAYISIYIFYYRLHILLLLILSRAAYFVISYLSLSFTKSKAASSDLHKNCDPYNRLLKLTRCPASTMKRWEGLATSSSQLATIDSDGRKSNDTMEGGFDGSRHQTKVESR